MSHYQEPVPPGKDPELWELAQKRINFKRHLFTYIVVNAFLWIIWFFSNGGNIRAGSIPWPVWPMLGWGLGLAMQYAHTFVLYKNNSVEKEYEKLEKEKSLK